MWAVVEIKDMDIFSPRKPIMGGFHSDGKDNPAKKKKKVEILQVASNPSTHSTAENEKLVLLC